MSSQEDEERRRERALHVHDNICDLTEGSYYTYLRSIFTDDEIMCLAKTAAEVVDEISHDLLRVFLSTRQIEVAMKAYRELIEEDEYDE